MKRISVALGMALAAVFAFAAPALGQAYPPYPPQPGGDGSATTGIRGGGDLAFTGADIAVWMLIAAALIVAGIVAVLLGRRRSATQVQ